MNSWNYRTGMNKSFRTHFSLIVIAMTVSFFVFCGNLGSKHEKTQVTSLIVEQGQPSAAGIDSSGIEQAETRQDSAGANAEIPADTEIAIETPHKQPEPDAAASEADTIAVAQEDSNHTSSERAGQIAVNTLREAAVVTSRDSLEKISIAGRIDVPVGTIAPKLAILPENCWPDSDRVRYNLSSEIADSHPTGNYIPRSIANNAWGVGERLVFSVNYGSYDAGKATMSVLDTECVNGSICYHVQTTASSNGFISNFYQVRDEVNSFIDMEGMFSRRLEQKLKEGNYKTERYIDFYPDRLIALSTGRKNPLTEVPLYVQDVLSSLYTIRLYDLEVGKDVYITTYADGKVYTLRVRVLKMETIRVPAGNFNCFVVEPLLQSDTIFRQKGRLTVWLTADENKIPVKMTSKIVVGNIGTNLESYTLGEIQ